MPAVLGWIVPSIEGGLPVRQKTRRRLSLVTAGGVALALLCGTAGAQNKAPEQPAANVESVQPKPAEPAAPLGPPAEVTGFRDARFGMTEEQVRTAIQKAFPAAAAKLKIFPQATEKTTVMSLGVADLLPNAGVAQVSYILGFKTKKLIQVNIMWRSDGSEQSDETVVGTANSLREYFAAQSYKTGSVIANRQLGENSILVFRGADAQDRMVIVVLNGASAARRKDEKGSRLPPLTRLLLRSK